MKKIINYIFVSLFSIAIMVSCNGNNPQDPNDNGNNGNDTTQTGDNGDKEPEVEIPNFKQQKWTDFHKELINKWNITTFLPEPTLDVLTIDFQGAAEGWPSGWYVVTFAPNSGGNKLYIEQLWKLSQDPQSGWIEETRMTDAEGNKVPAFTNNKDYIVTEGGESQSNEWICIYPFADTQEK